MGENKEQKLIRETKDKRDIISRPDALMVVERVNITEFAKRGLATEVKRIEDHKDSKKRH
jgi:hypothetical protein